MRTYALAECYRALAQDGVPAVGSVVGWQVQREWQALMRRAWQNGFHGAVLINGFNEDSMKEIMIVTIYTSLRVKK